MIFQNDSHSRINSLWQPPSQLLSHVGRDICALEGLAVIRGQIGTVIHVLLHSVIHNLGSTLSASGNTQFILPSSFFFEAGSKCIKMHIKGRSSTHELIEKTGTRERVRPSCGFGVLKGRWLSYSFTGPISLALLFCVPPNSGTLRRLQSRYQPRLPSSKTKTEPKSLFQDYVPSVSLCGPFHRQPKYALMDEG